MKTPKERALEFVAQGYKQISRKYRRLVRVPPIPEGKTPLEALKEANPAWYERLMAETNRQALHSYCDHHYLNGADRVELDRETFHEYLLATGRSPGALSEYDALGNRIGPYRREKDVEEV